MYTVTLEHKYCKCIRVLKGESLAKIYKNNNLDMNIWIVKAVDYND